MESFCLALTLAVLIYADQQPAKIWNQYPYIVSIHSNSVTGNFICAGSLLSTAWVLTTAHCLTRHAHRIRYGDMTTTDNATFSLILQRIHHRNSRSHYFFRASQRLTPKANNIGLAMIEEIHYKEIAVLSAVDYSAILGYEVSYFEFTYLPVFKAKIYKGNKFRIITGFKKKKRRFPKVKKKIANFSDQAPLQNPKVYRVGEGIAVLCENRKLPGPNICVANKCYDFDLSDPTTTFIVPDYGAPLVHDRRVVGVTSEVETSYSRYTPVSPYLDWIRLHMEQDYPSCRAGYCIRSKYG